MSKEFVGRGLWLSANRQVSVDISRAEVSVDISRAEVSLSMVAVERLPEGWVNSIMSQVRAVKALD